MEICTGPAKCVVCASSALPIFENGAIDLKTSALSSVLIRSRCTVGQFLSQYEVVHHESSDEQNEFLCRACLELVVACDELQFSFCAKIDVLRSMASVHLVARSTERRFGSFVVVEEKQPVTSMKAIVEDEVIPCDANVTDHGNYVEIDDVVDTVKVAPSPDPLLSIPRPADEPVDAVDDHPELCESPRAQNSQEVEEEVRPTKKPSSKKTRTLRGARVRTSDKESRGKSPEASTDKFCPICYEPALHGKFMDHLRTAHPGVQRVRPVPMAWLSCDLCSFKAKFKDRLNRHMQTKHQLGKMIPCPDCDHLLPNKERLLAHASRVHGKANAFKCTDCGKDFSTYQGLYNHSKSHWTTIDLRVCEECGEKVDSRWFQRHMFQQHRQKKSENCSCEHCGKTFRCKKGLRKHLARFHGVGEVKPQSNEVAKECSKCGKKVKSDEYFYAHMFVVHGIEEPGLKRRPCPHCEEVFYTMSKLETHIMLHTGQKKYACDECGYSTRFSGNLHKHRKGVHGKTGGIVSKNEISRVVLN